MPSRRRHRRRTSRSLTVFSTVAVLTTWVLIGSSELAGQPTAGIAPPAAFPPPVWNASSPHERVGANASEAQAIVSAATSVPSSPLDEPIRLLDKAAQAYQGIRDYTCLFIKKERIHGELQPDHLIGMAVRVEPFSVAMRWHGPRQFSGQEAIYVTGSNQGKMRVRSPGLLGAIGFVSLDPRDSRVAQTSRHPITEVGIGNLIAQHQRCWDLERRQGRTHASIADYEYNRRPCTRVETVRSEKAPGQYAYRCLVYFDKENHLPIRFEAYDWPRPGGPPSGDLIELFSYIDLKLNVGVRDEVFAR
jgi:hypothetical protein